MASIWKEGTVVASTSLSSSVVIQSRLRQPSKLSPETNWLLNPLTLNPSDPAAI